MMNKNLFILLRNVLLMVCMFSLACCSPKNEGADTASDNVNVELIDRKAEAIDDLFAYMQNKMDENFYNEESRDLLLDIMREGVQDISATDDIAKVDTMYSEITQKIDAVDTIKIIGSTYSLQEAYEKGILTKKELQELATKINYGFEKLELSEELSLEIRTAVAKKLESDAWDSLDYVEFSPEEIAIYRYYGKYGPSAYVVLFDYGQHPGVSSPAELNIDDVIFYFGQSRFTSQLVVYVK